MKKVILGLSGVVILAFVVILFVNAQSAQSNPQEVKKPAKEATMDCGKCTSTGSAGCGTKTDAKNTSEVKSGSENNKGKTSDAKAVATPCCPPAVKK